MTRKPLTSENTCIYKPIGESMDLDVLAERLREMKQSGMAHAIDQMHTFPEEYAGWPWEERVAAMIHEQLLYSYDNKVNNCIKNAKFRYPNASLDSILYLEDRKLDYTFLSDLCQGDWVLDGKKNLIITGPAGSGKTYVACAIGMSICSLAQPVRYTRTEDMLRELQEARLAGTYDKILNRYAKVPLLILDDFLLTSMNETQTNDLLNVVEKRYLSTSLLISTQFNLEEWYDRLLVTAERKALCESILDRILHNSKDLVIESQISMRERLSHMGNAGN